MTPSAPIRYTRVQPEDETQLLYPHCAACNARYPLREMWGEVVGNFVILICESCRQKRDEGAKEKSS